jgi:hypothetical protein
VTARSAIFVKCLLHAAVDLQAKTVGHDDVGTRGLGPYIQAANHDWQAEAQSYLSKWLGRVQGQRHSIREAHAGWAAGVAGAYLIDTGRMVELG